MDGSHKTDRRGNHEERKRVAQFSIDVVAVKRMRVVFPVEEIKTPVQKFPDKPCSPSMQNKAVKQVLHKSPDEHACSIENDRNNRINRAEREEQHRQA